MTTEVAATEAVELDCYGVRLLLKTVPLHKPATKLLRTSKKAVEHYLQCQHCSELGLEVIRGEKISCYDALLEWAKEPGALYHRLYPGIIGPKTLAQILAIEHVYGRQKWHADGASGGPLFGTACRDICCRDMAAHWRQSGVSSMNDGESAVIHEFPLLISIFQRQCWPLDALLHIQTNRIASLLGEIESGKVTLSAGHYRQTWMLMHEVKAHVAALQQLALSGYNITCKP